MTKKPNGRFLLTWNERKDPEISEFFNNIEEGMYSHTLREVIKSYMKHNENNQLKNSSGQLFKDVQELSNNNNVDNHNEKREQKDDNSDYVEFSPSDI